MGLKSRQKRERWAAVDAVIRRAIAGDAVAIEIVRKASEAVKDRYRAAAWAKDKRGPLTNPLLWAIETDAERAKRLATSEAVKGTMWEGIV